MVEHIFNKIKDKGRKYIDNDKNIILFFVIATLIASILSGIIINIYIVYNPTNGDFQTYNMVRRLLSGQIPFRDFMVYLGFGPLYLSSIITLINNTFSFNLIVVDIVSILMFSVIIYLINYIISKNIKYSVIISSLITIIFCAIMYIKLPLNTDSADSIFTKIIFKFGSILNNRVIAVLFDGFKNKSAFADATVLFFDNIRVLAEPGNSLRLWRSFVVILISILLLNFTRNEKSWLRRVFKKRKFHLVSAICGTIGGAIILWSNDYGVASYISISFCYFLWMIKNKKFSNVITGTLMYIFCTFISVFILVNIFTLGNFTNWLNFTLSTSNYQSWYYLYKQKCFLLNQLDKTIYIYIYMIVIVFNVVKVLKNKNISDYAMNLVVLFMLLSIFLGHYLYQIGSCAEVGPIIYYRLIDVLVLCGVIYKLIFDVLCKGKLKRKLTMFFGIFITTIILLLGVTAIHGKQNCHGTYLGGKINGVVLNHGENLCELQEVIGDSSYFSTYATGFEALNEDFQPTRFDYIIHVLGDDYRREYIRDFVDSNSSYVLTIDPEFTFWEGWVQNANWFFYRELYRRYTPVERIGYNIIWENYRQDKVSVEDFEINIIQTSKQTVDIGIKTGNRGNYIADVRLNFDTKIDGDTPKFAAHHSAVYVRLSNASYGGIKDYGYYSKFYIPKKSNEYYIPIYIKDGEGHASLSYEPNNYGSLHIKSATLEGVFNNDIEYLEK